MRKGEKYILTVATVLALVKAKPRSTQQLCKLLDIVDVGNGSRTLMRWLKAFEGEGIVKRHGKLTVPTGGKGQILWAWCDRPSRPLAGPPVDLKAEP